MNVLACQQRSAEWYAARLGRVTSSRACDMLATIKKGEAAARRDLRTQLVIERLTGCSQDDAYVSAEMRRGIEKEADALRAYQIETGHLARTVGFCQHDNLQAGCSPDGEISGFAGLVEVKCPKAATHLFYLRSREIPYDYKAQITHALWITGAAWCDFVSFDDRFPEPLRLFVSRVRRDQIDLKAYELLVRMFLAEVDREVEDVRELMAEAVA